MEKNKEEYLYVYMFVIHPTVHEVPIYAKDDNEAVSVMLAEYQRVPGLRSHHKALLKSVDGITIDNVFYPPWRGIQTLYLYVMQYIEHASGEPARDVKQKALYASDINAATKMMNLFYASNGLGNHHKSLERNIEGITINDIYYPPEKQEGI